MSSILDTLNPKQREVIEHYKALVPFDNISWFIGEKGVGGEVEVLGLGLTFVWSFVLSDDGSVATSEASISQFSTGIEA
jgi:hypothetical protein